MLVHIHCHSVTPIINLVNVYFNVYLYIWSNRTQGMVCQIFQQSAMNLQLSNDFSAVFSYANVYEISYLQHILFVVSPFYHQILLRKLRVVLVFTHIPTYKNKLADPPLCVKLFLCSHDSHICVYALRALQRKLVYGFKHDIDDNQVRVVYIITGAKNVYPDELM